MASDDQSYDAGTARLTIEPKLSDSFEGDLAAMVAAVPPMAVELEAPDMRQFADELDKAWADQDHRLALDLDPQLSDDALDGISQRFEDAGPFQVQIAADMDKFAQDLDSQWRQIATKHTLPIQVTPDFDNRALSDQLPGYTRITGDLDLARAESQLEAFFSLIPVYRIPVEMDFGEAEAQLAEFRAQAARGGAALPTQPSPPTSAPTAAPASSATPDRALAAMQQEDRREQGLQLTSNQAQAKTQWETPSKEAQQATADMDAAQKKLADDAEKSTKAWQDWDNAVAKKPDDAVFSALTSGMDKVGSKLDDLGAKALKWASIGALGGGAIATLGAAGLAGILGAHGVMGALSDEKAVTEEQRDPEAQLDRQAKIQSAADQQRTANEGLSDATFKVSDAQTAAKLSSMNLADAYKEVGRQVRDATDALTDAQLAEEGAALGVAGARQHLMQDLMSGTADPLAIETDVYGVQAANQKYSESQKKTSDQSVDTAETQQRGVAGSTTIIQATQSNADAQHGVALALQGVRDAEISVSEAATDMHRALMPTDAENKLNLAMSKLSPEARDFVNVLHSEVSPAMHDLSAAISPNLFAGLGESFNTALQDQLPGMESGFGQIGTALNSMFKDTFSQLDSLFTQLESDGTMQKFIQGVGDTLQGIAPLITGLTKGLVDLGTELGPHLGPLFAELGNFLSQLGKPLGELGGAIADALTKLGPALSPLLNVLGQGLSDLITGLAPSLPVVAQAFTDVFNAIEPLMAPLSELGATIISTIATNVSSLAQGLAPLILALAQGLQPLIPILTSTMRDLEPIFAQLATTIGQALLQGLDDILPHLPDLVAAFANLGEQVAPLLPDLIDLATTIIPPLMDVISAGIGPLTDMINAFADMVYWVGQFGSSLDDVFGTLNSNPITHALVESLPVIGSLLGTDTGSPQSGPSPSAGDTYDTKNAFGSGGHVTGPGGPRDDKVPAMLSNGEFVVNADATAQHRGTLEAINGFASGGYVAGKQGESAIGHEAKREAVRQSRRRVLGFQNGGIVDDGGGGSDSSFGSDSDSSDSGDSNYPGTDSGGGGGDASFGSDNSTPAYNPSAFNASLGPVSGTTGGNQAVGGMPLATTPSATTGVSGQTFPSAWQADGATGGPVNAVQWANAHATTPYVWGGTDMEGADCSGWVGDLQQVAMGTPDPTGRLGTTANVLDGSWPSFIPGASKDDLFVIGASNQHMVASILGVDMEERQSGETARIGTKAVSPWDSQFTTIGHIDPTAFVPAFNDPKQSASGTGTGTGTDSGTTSGNAADNALANQPLAVTTPVPSTWSGAANSLISRGLSQLWWGDPAAQAAAATNAKPGSNPQLNGGWHGTLQNMFQGFADNTPKDQQNAWSTFLLGPNSAANATPNAGTGQNGPAGTNGQNSTAGLTGLGSNGGLLGIIGVGLLGDGQKIKGLSQLLGEGLDFELQPVEKAVGWNDSFEGSPAALWQAGNDLQADQAAASMSTSASSSPAAKPQTPTHGDPSTVSGGAQPSGTNKMAQPKSGIEASQTSTSNTPGDQLNEMVQQQSGDAYASQFGVSSAVVGAVKDASSQFGWDSGTQWNALDQLIGHESSWNPQASAEPASDAYGLFQFLSTTWDTVGGTKTEDPRMQAVYGDKYISQKYGDPASAWSFWQAQSPHWYASGGDVSGDGGSISDYIPAMLSDGEFVVNSRSADNYRPLLKLINSDQAGTKGLNRPQTVPTREMLSSAGVTSHVDQSATYNVHAHDIDGSVKAMKLLEAQRAAKAGTYLGRWRNYRGI